MTFVSRLPAIVLLTLAVSLTRAQNGADAGESVLAGYLAKPDASYHWEQRRQGKLRGVQFVELLLVSQTWRGIPWKHQLYILKPKRLDNGDGHGLLMISGGRWYPEYDEPRADAELPRRAKLFARLAKRLRTPIAVLRQVPYQPLFDGLTEDRIIALTFDRYLRTGEQDWPLLLPMVKSATKAMDATQEFAAKEWSLPLNTFTVIGASKRGWTTWLVGAMDKRATAIAPAVIDMVKMEEQLDHQETVWGAPSYKIQPYLDIELPARLATDSGRALQAIVDPYSYRSQLTQPKLIVVGTNDRYWPLDALNLYWPELVGPKYALYVPNNRHSLSDYRRVFGSVAALHRNAATGTPIPALQWRFQEQADSVIMHMSTETKPRRVVAWVAHAPTRDFREAKWTKRRAQRRSGGYRFDLAKPATGYTALFGEAVFGKLGKTYYLSSNVRILTRDGIIENASQAQLRHQ